MQDGATEEVTITGGVAKLRLNSSGSTHPLQIYQDGSHAFIKNGASGGNVTVNTLGGGYFSYISGSTERVRFDSNGNVSIGGTIGSAPAIELTQAGAATFAGLVTTESYFRSQRTSNAFVFQGRLNGVQTSLIKSDGTSTWSGSLQVDGNPNNGGAAGCRLRNGGGVQSCATGGNTNVWAGFQEGTADSTSEITATGNATFAGDVTAANITAFKNSLTTGAAAATSLSELQSAIATALALL